MTPASAHLRYERKFLPPDGSLAELLALVRRHPAGFHEIFGERWVNNLYLDTPELTHYHQHINGCANRVKFRVRWYGDLCRHAPQPVLELKARHGLLSRKETYALPPLTLNGDFRRELLESGYGRHGLPDALRPSLRCLEPALTNRYRRRYFLSGDGAVRLTLDWDLQFFAPRHANGSLRAFRHGSPGLIMELKYGDAHTVEAAQVASAFPFRLDRCSKYVLGIECLDGG